MPRSLVKTDCRQYLITVANYNKYQLSLINRHNALAASLQTCCKQRWMLSVTTMQPN